MNTTIIFWFIETDTYYQIWKKRIELRSYLIVDLVLPCVSDAARPRTTREEKRLAYTCSPPDEFDSINKATYISRLSANYHFLSFDMRINYS